MYLYLEISYEMRETIMKNLVTRHMKTSYGNT